MAGASPGAAMSSPGRVERGLRASFGPERAEVLLRRRRLGAASRAVAKAELLWMPYFLVTLELGGEDESARLRMLVDGRTGGAARLDGGSAWQPSPPLLVSPRLTATEATRRARALLRRGLLSRRGPRPRLELEGQHVELVAYPFWMEVFERRRGRYDVRLVDAVGGRLAGGDTRRAVLEALVEEARREVEPAAPMGSEISS